VSRLNDDEIEEVGQKVIKMQKVWYGPIRSSKSTMMEKILLKKKIFRNISI